ncbi:mechanosensitive ion channel domain-containing protein [Stenotrophomonas rhizophila]|uniref:mechanosensitive ion channel domain-containing protein n=1 Tax=Stenotrophomonas rhizophila TaxID=216778 RepID=UPI0028D78C2F|nr:mechanosensitive ion channel domain-containing protein [Stenotrophomonas rhizophila]
MDRWRAARSALPTWLDEWLDVVVPIGELLLIGMIAWLLVRSIAATARTMASRYEFPPAFAVGARRIAATLIYAAALLLALERLGVSARVLWSALTGFAAVGAVAFFAAWSVLSNIFCSFLIFATKPFRLYDQIEVIDSADKPGICGRVVDINLIYTTLQDSNPASKNCLLKVPNSLFFQRMMRHWH